MTESQYIAATNFGSLRAAISALDAVFMLEAQADYLRQARAILYKLRDAELAKLEIDAE
jgi:hypothetical protein